VRSCLLLLLPLLLGMLCFGSCTQLPPLLR
jgi:hypothetical protein